VRVFSLDRFLEVIQEHFKLAELPSGSALVIDDLGFDSLDLLHLMVLLETMLPNFELPEQLDLDDLTLLDAYHYYSIRAQQYAPQEP